MSATLARQAGRIQLEQSDMCHIWNRSKMAKGGYSRAAIEETQQLIKEHRTEVKKWRSEVLTLPGITRWRLWSKDTWQLFAKIKWMAVLLVEMAPHEIDRYDGGAHARVHLHHDWRHLGPERHQHHLMMKRAPKQKVCHPHICIYTICFPAHNFCQGSHMP